MKGKIYSNNKKINKPRAQISWNTGERVHRPKKGKGSYKRTNYK